MAPCCGTERICFFCSQSSFTFLLSHRLSVHERSSLTHGEVELFFCLRSKKQYVINWLLICYRASCCCAGCESQCLFFSSGRAKFISQSLVCHTIQDTSNLWLPVTPCNWRERFSFIQSCNFENLPLIDDGRAWLCECV